MELRGYSSDPQKCFDYENAFYWFSEVNRIAKQIAHFELYKRTIGIPGDILEFGVFKGSSLIKIATFREILEYSDSRKIVGFDTFKEFPVTEEASEDDKKCANTFHATQGGLPLEVNSLKQIFDLKGFKNINLIQGNLIETLPIYLKNNPHTRISFLHIDVDLYKPTLFVMEKLWDRVSSGGVIMLDDYPDVEGATNAIDDFLEMNKIEIKVQKTKYYFNPSFIVKP
ncbi:MAG: hypothetical protein CBB97_14975 [Candidatus Endolissoclinum sp. TMED37]|nr:MAG: hypothetical protein CBB97_14975 [Candidatus Endolissoclinum sp. TMED37]|tara:strand:- start:1951 stop:2631 length:681 start_codon:yes stop_codon:yes gene_type:complete